MSSSSLEDKDQAQDPDIQRNTGVFGDNADLQR